MPRTPTHTCERCGHKGRPRTATTTYLCNACIRTRNYQQTPHTSHDQLPPGEWQRDGLIWRYHPEPNDACGKHAGTQRGYRRHQRHNQTPCDPCNEAWRAASMLPPDQLQPCGTYAAYRRHQRRSEQPCPDCQTAAYEYRAARYRERLNRKAA